MLTLEQFRANRNVLFWGLHAAGWTAYGLTQYFSALIYEKPSNYGQVIVVAALAGFVLTIPMRYLYRRMWGRTLRATAFIWVLATCYLTGLAIRLIINLTYKDLIEPGFEFTTLFELFGGTMSFSAALTDTGTPDPFESSTSYIGLRSEYEHLWNVYDDWPTVFLGIGTRAWVRDIRDATSQSGVDVAPGQQTWWTIYPYVGLEKKWLRPNGSELFFSGRLGATVLTYQRTQWPDDPAFYPRPGITGQVELGWRTPRFFVSGYFEAMSWQNSQDEHLHNGSTTDYYFSPAAQMYTTGLKVGLCF